MMPQAGPCSMDDGAFTPLTLPPPAGPATPKIGERRTRAESTDYRTVASGQAPRAWSGLPGRPRGAASGERQAPRIRTMSHVQQETTAIIAKQAKDDNDHIN